MKLKTRKATSKLYAADGGLQVLHKKCKKSSAVAAHKEDATAALITSSARKWKKDRNLASPTRSYVRNKGLKMETKSDEHIEDVGRDLRLAFSNIDGSLTNQKGTANLSSHAPILETIFSPVFHLFKGLNGESSTSFTNNDDQLEDVNQVTDAAFQKAQSNSPSEGMSRRILRPCSSDAVKELITEETAGSGPDATDIFTSSKVDHVASITSASDEELLSSQVTFDVVDDCIGWSLANERGRSEDVEHLEEGLLDSDGASLYIAVQQTKSIECNNEKEGGKATPDEDDFDDFDPYLFIKHLPDLSEVVSPCRPMLLPRQTRRCPPITLVLDLDETLVHSTLEHCDEADFTFPVSFNHQEHTVYVRCRPHLQMFLERVARMFEIIVFTASQGIYAEQLLNVLDPKRKLIRHRVYRDSCVFVEGNYLKDLTVLGRDLAKVAIIDNSPQAFGFQVDNGIPIESWFDDQSDNALICLLSFLENLVGVDDVRPIIARKFNLRQKIAAAIDPPPVANQGDPFDRHP